jgi:CHAT domain-containing protein
MKAHSLSLIELQGKKQVADAAAVEESLSKLKEDLEKVQTRIRATSKSYAALKQPQSLTLKKIQQQLLDDNTLLLEYALGEKRSYLWAVSRTSVTSYVLPKRTEIEKAALELRDLLTAFEPPKPDEDNTEYVKRLTKSQSDYQRRASDFSKIVFGRAGPLLGSKRLVIVPDGALHFIPFEALPMPGIVRSGATARNRSRRRSEGSQQQLLVQNNEITYLPSATSLALIRDFPRTQTNKTLAVFADPVFTISDERIPFASRTTQPQVKEQLLSSKLIRALRDFDSGSDTGLNLERLPNTLAEARKAIAVFPMDSGMLAASFKANRATAMSHELASYSIVHFATHGLLNDKHPELSGIVLSMVNEQGRQQDGFLQLQDVYNLRLPVDLVVLSACRTGIGKQIKGEGLIGLTRGFMYAGAARVVASLWKVDDKSTAALMERFYWHLIKKQLSPSAALKAAKVDVMRSRSEWSAPYFWAGFVIQGDWK